MKKCICNKIDLIGEINAFDSDFAFTKLERELHSLVLKKILIEISFHKNKFWERIFECSHCRRRWILVEPEYGYRGHWKELLE